MGNVIRKGQWIDNLHFYADYRNVKDYNMQIIGIETGFQFEQMIINMFRRAGLTVYDTPTSNDYGADLIIEYNGYRIAGQCKYYNKPVGVKAVQEIMGALAYYECDVGMVITNDIFTQQAINLANSNNILLFDETALEQCSGDGSLFFPAFDEFLGVVQSSNRTPVQEEWTINDLVIRYGVSQQTIMKNYMAYGLPFYKIGREYRFSPKDVYWWEVDKHYVFYGRKQKITLPGYENYRVSMNKRIRQAKQNGDRETVKKLKRQMRSHKVSRLSDKTKRTIIYILCFAPIVILLLYTYYIALRAAHGGTL